MSNSHPITLAIEPVLRGMCREPERLTVEEVRANGSLTIYAGPSPDDYHLLNGKGGRTNDAISRLVRRAGSSLNINAEFKLNPADYVTPVKHPFRDNPRFDETQFLNLFLPVCRLIGIASKLELVSRNGKLIVLVKANGINDTFAIEDCNMVFYPFGYVNGRKISVEQLPERT